MRKPYKNQIIIYVIAFMLVTAGYLNYADKNVVKVSSQGNESRSDENIGDATLVNSNETESNNENKDSDESTSENKTTSNNSQKNTNNDEEESEDNTVTTSENVTNSNINKDDYFSYSKLEREKMYSQMLETYQKMIDNANLSEEQKAIASQEIKNINDIKNSIMISENLIKTKGFEDVVIFVNSDSVNVVVKATKLEDDQIAQIQNIITREMNCSIENIHIMMN